MVRTANALNRPPLAPGANPVKLAADGKTLHKATYATDLRKGGYLIRLTGPTPDRFVGRTIPVQRRDGSQTQETLEKIVWTGKDEENGEAVALYKFLPKPIDDEIPF